jgi:two-component system sensor histidine kinase CreC
MNLIARLLLVFIVVSGIGFFLFTRKELEETKRRYREATEEPLVDFASIMAAHIALHWTEEDHGLAALDTTFKSAYAQQFSAKIYDLEKTTVDLRIYVTDMAGKVLFDSTAIDTGKDYSRWNDVIQALRGLPGARSSSEDFFGSGRMLYVSRPLKVQDKIVGAVSVGKATRSADLFIKGAKQSTKILGFTVFALTLAAAVTLFLLVTLPARRALQARAYIESYVQALTHELKSPISGIRAAAELLREDLPKERKAQFVSNIEREVSRLQGLSTKMLHLAALQSRGALDQKEKFKLGEILQEVLDNLRPSLEAKNIKTELSLDGRAEIEGDSALVQEALTNIMGNALEFSPQDGFIKIALSASDAQVICSVQDQGPGIPAWALSRVFERFFSLPRPETGHKSSGLGLTLVKEIMALHGGQVKIENVSPHGAKVELKFRRALA